MYSRYFSYASMIFFIVSILIFILLILKNNKKIKSLGIVLNIFASLQIILINIYYYYSITKVFDYSDDIFKIMIDYVFDFNFTFSLVTVILLIVLIMLYKLININIFKIITFVFISIAFCVLVFFKSFIITKTVIDLGTLAISLIMYYLNFLTIPLIYFKKEN